MADAAAHPSHRSFTRQTRARALGCGHGGTASGGAEARALKIFLLTLALLLPDGGTVDVPIEIWKFRSLSDCAMSADYLNKGTARGVHTYGCVETDAVRLAALRARTRE